MAGTSCRCDGHDFADVRRAIDEALADPRPSLIACRTIIGLGAPNKQGTAATHGAALGADEVAAAREAARLGLCRPFEIPAEILAAWREAGHGGGQGAHEEWRARLAASAERDGVRPPDGGAAARRLRPRRLSRRPRRRPAEGRHPQGVRARAGGDQRRLPETIGGSADLTGSNNTKTKAQKPLTKDDYSGRYIYYGIREFGMAAAMNGMALHGGVIPYGGTFLVFSDYCRPGDPPVGAAAGPGRSM